MSDAHPTPPLFPPESKHTIVVRIELDDTLVALARRLGNTFNAKLDTLLRRTETLMAIGAETARVLREIDAATTAIAARIEKLIAGADLTDEEREAFDAEIARLRALGSDPANPVPA